MPRSPRSTKDAVARSQALAALVRHALGEPQNGQGLLALSPREEELLRRPPAEWEPQDVVDAAWRGEALGTLAWALGLAELPPYDTPFEHNRLARKLDVGAAELRPRRELDAACESARLWHWRARTAELARAERLELPSRWSSQQQLVAAAAMRGHESGLLPAPLRGDFPAFGKAYRELADEEHALAHSIAAERHYALEWLCEAGEDWDSVRTDT